MAKALVDKDLKKISRLERSSREFSRIALTLALAFLLLIWAAAFFFSAGSDARLLIVLAAVLGGYMALNIGANDVANNMGPAVGARALSIGTALLIAAVFEAAGAILAGGDVIETVSKGIIEARKMPSADEFTSAMTAALLAGALWLNVATWVGAPVSTTHSIVGGIVGAGIAVAGFGAINWPVMGRIAASWVVSPALGGAIAVVFLALVNAKILVQQDKIRAARTWVPVLLALMVGAFTAYLLMKGLKQIWKPGAWLILIMSVAATLGSYAVLRPIIARQSDYLPNARKSVNALFTIPLICAAALLSFAHGANDVANAVGPLAAIFTTANSGRIEQSVDVPLWIMLVGAVGIATGLALFGPRVIRTVGRKITKLNPVRAFCVALSAAVTVIAASALGLPVSSTHIAVGAIFGIGFYREFVRHRRRTRWPALDADNIASEAVLTMDAIDSEPWELSKQGERKDFGKLIRKNEKRRLVRRSHLLTIVGAWVITVPVTAILSAGLFAILRYVL